MRKSPLITLCLIVCAIFTLTCPSQAAISSLNLADVGTSYSATQGTLSLQDTISLVISYDDGTPQNTISDTTFNMQTILDTDDSFNGIVSGTFTGGSFNLVDNSNSTLFSGDIQDLQIIEMLDGRGILSGTGTFQVTGGSLQNDFQHAFGDLVQITFRIQPVTIADLQSDYTGTTNLSLVPVPEPTTIALLGLGFAGVAALKKRISPRP